MNGEVSDQTLKKKAYVLCKEFLGGQWKEISFEEFQCSEVSGGFSNTLYRCSLPENIAKISKIPGQILLRIYGPIQDDPNVVVAEAVTFMLLSERRLGPKLYGLFQGGRLEEFIPSHSLSSDEMRLYAHLIAQELAKIHALNVPVRKVPDLVNTNMTKWLIDVEDVLQNDQGKYFLSLNEYRKEIEWLTTEMAKTKSPAVYCHNDLQGGNVLYREDITQNGNPNLVLIDFEFGGYNYRGFDFANHFCEWCFDYGTMEYPHFQMKMDKFPTRQEQIDFFTIYLDQLSKEGVLLKRPPDEEIEIMLREINIFVCSVHLFWNLWSAKMCLTSSYAFVHREHGKTRKMLYQKSKEQYLTSVLNSIEHH